MMSFRAGLLAAIALASAVAAQSQPLPRATPGQFGGHLPPLEARRQRDLAQRFARAIGKPVDGADATLRPPSPLHGPGHFEWNVTTILDGRPREQSRSIEIGPRTGRVVAFDDLDARTRGADRPGRHSTGEVWWVDLAGGGASEPRYQPSERILTSGRLLQKSETLGLGRAVAAGRETPLREAPRTALRCRETVGATPQQFAWDAKRRLLAWESASGAWQGVTLDKGEAQRLTRWWKERTRLRIGYAPHDRR